ncbi:hypothetical protein [Paenibacillus sp. FSL R7-0128]|uniref:hypothetical protein n=1 Tax=Paenibacillus sp. FSL R7-0128 TaxID=2954529 RepID=UPI0030F536C5
MELRKFPVTAPSGNEYEAEVRREYGAFGGFALHFKLYERQACRGLFGKKRVKRICVADATYWEAEVTDVIALVKRQVERLEKRKHVDMMREASYNTFNAWDRRLDV